MKRRNMLAIAILLALLLAWTGSALASNPPAIAWWVIGSGGSGPSSAPHVTLNGTLGQPVSGPSSGSSITLNAGFWSGSSHVGNTYVPMVRK